MVCIGVVCVLAVPDVVLHSVLEVIREMYPKLQDGELSGERHPLEQRLAICTTRLPSIIQTSVSRSHIQLSVSHNDLHNSAALFQTFAVLHTSNSYAYSIPYLKSSPFPNTR